MSGLRPGMEWGCGGTQSEPRERAVPLQSYQKGSSSALARNFMRGTCCRQYSA